VPDKVRPRRILGSKKARVVKRMRIVILVAIKLTEDGGAGRKGGRGGGRAFKWSDSNTVRTYIL
jgi:hypothetical protein